MTRKAIFTLISFLLLCCFLSCRKPVSYPPLLQADSLLETDLPDSARHLLQSIPATKEWTKSEHALFCLLLAESSYLQPGYQLQSDSLIDIALDFYDNSNSLNMVRALICKANIQENFDSWQRALVNYQEALRILESYPDAYWLHYITYANIAEFYANRGKYAKAKEIYLKAYHWSSFIHNTHYAAHLCSHIGTIYLHLELPDSALYYQRKALSLSQESTLPCNAQPIYYEAGNTFFETRHYEACLQPMKQALQKGASTADSCRFHYLIGRCYEQLNQPDSAAYYLLKSNHSNDIDLQAASYYTLYSVYAGQKDFELANQYLLQYTNLIDDSYTESYNEKETNRKYQYREKRAHRQEHFQEKRLRRTILITGSILVLLLIIIYQYKLRKKQIQQLTYLNKMERLHVDLATSQKEIAHQESIIALLKQESNHRQHEISQKEEELHHLKEQRWQIQKDFFAQTNIYHTLNQKLNNKKAHASKEKQVLSYTEQDALRQAIRQIFAEYIAELQNENPDLKEEDIYMLCLREYGLTYAQIAQCFGHTDPQVFIQRNYRLKKQKENKTVPNNNSQN